MKVHFKHQQGDPRVTIAIEEISREALFDLVLNGNNTIDLDIGVTFVHPKEQYSKKLGREQSLAQVTKKLATLTNITVFPECNRTIFHFIAQVPDARPQVSFETRLDFGLSVCKKSNRVHLEYAYVME